MDINRHGKGYGLYEPSGGTAPDIAGQDKANPCAQVLSAALMLRHSFGLEAEAKAIELAVEKTVADGVRTADIAGGGITMQTSNPTLAYAATTPITYNGVVVKPGDVVVPVNASFSQPSYSTANASFGVSKDNTSVELFVDNLTDERPQLYTSANDGVRRVTTLRPLTVGIRLSFKN
jgi:outer membrane receptor protein involved in Fe transport